MIPTTDKESKELYNEFLFYMKTSHTNHLPTNIEILYKQLYSELNKKNQHKRNNIVVNLRQK